MLHIQALVTSSQGIEDLDATYASPSKYYQSPVLQAMDFGLVLRRRYTCSILIKDKSSGSAIESDKYGAQECKIIFLAMIRSKCFKRKIGPDLQQWSKERKYHRPLHKIHYTNKLIHKDCCKASLSGNM